MRRALVLVSVESPWQGPQKASPIASESLARCKAMGRGDSFMGRDWFPGGPYNHPGRGSIPRRSTFLKIARNH